MDVDHHRREDNGEPQLSDSHDVAMAIAAGGYEHTVGLSSVDPDT